MKKSLMFDADPKTKICSYDGRRVGTRTPDLYRFNVDLI